MPERESLSIIKAPRKFLLLESSYRRRKSEGRLEASSHVSSSGVYPTHRTRHMFSPSSPYWASTMRSIANSSRERVCFPTSGAQRTFMRTARVGRWPSSPGVSLLGAVSDSLSGHGRTSAGGGAGFCRPGCFGVIHPMTRHRESWRSDRWSIFPSGRNFRFRGCRCKAIGFPVGAETDIGTGRTNVRRTGSPYVILPETRRWAFLWSDLWPILPSGH
jgi:hypothetical protein